MKACWLICILVLITSSCFAQTTGVKLYGFNQIVAKGRQSSNETDEEGKTIKPKTEALNNVFVYLAYPAHLKLYPMEIWMKGKLYSVKEVPATTPVKIVYDNGQFKPDSVILIPLTKEVVTQLVLTERLPSKSTTIKRSLVENNDLVVVYKLNGKVHNHNLKKLKALRTGAMQ